jgi:hypothetical protein
LTAERYIFKHLTRTKRIAESPVFALLDTSKHSFDIFKDPVESNVTARLFNSNPVRQVIPAIMGKIREALSLEGGGTSTQLKAMKPAAARSGKISAEAIVNEEEMDESRTRRDDITKGRRDYLHIGPPSAQLASQGDSESDDAECWNRVPKTNESRYNATIDLSTSPATSGMSPDSPAATVVKISKTTKQQPVTKFLPSLMGGYWSGSEAGEDEAAAMAAAPPPLRKNRMGQQARRQLWEKKYGVNANHLKKQDQNQVQNRDKGWSSRAGAISRDDLTKQNGRTRGFSGPRRHGGAPPTEHAKGPRKKSAGKGSITAHTHEHKPLHPSWEAARKAKLQKSQATFQGKKVVFD